MSGKAAEQIVDEETRDKVFLQIRNLNDNNMCLDCEKKNPKWASIHLGIHLCLDCAGKHRQYGVGYSFIKSINLDAWNRKQLLFMEKGGNSRALEYFQKRGVITANNKHIDYRSPIVQQYKTLLTEEVQLELSGGVRVKPKEEKVVKEQQYIGAEEKKIEIPTAEMVSQQNTEPKKKKKDKKKIGAKQINIEDFQSLAFDNGVPTEQKEKIVKQYEKKKDSVENQGYVQTDVMGQVQVPKIEEPKELTEEEANKKLEELKQQKNVKAISSEQFKDTSIDNATIKQNLNKFSGATSISSAAFFNKEEESNRGQVMENIKDYVSNAGGKIFSKIQGYWNK